MSALIAASRDALESVLIDHRLTTPVQCSCGWREPDDGGTHAAHVRDALLASHAVIDAATLADDEALVERVTSEFCKPALNEAAYADFTRDYLRALTAALAEREVRP